VERRDDPPSRDDDVTPELAAALALGVQAFVVGLSGAMSPGPYLTVTIARTMQKGPFSAALMLVGHGLLEAALLIGFAFGLQYFLQLTMVTFVLAVVGGAVVLWTGYGLLAGALRGTIAADLETAEDAGMSGHPLKAVAHGAIVSISNPYWTIWWATIGVKLAADGLAIGPVGVLAFFVGHQLADVSWYAFVIVVVHRGKGLLTPRVYCVIMGVLGAALLYIGARFVGEGFGLHLPWLSF
jgi:threonine/homoserine/homoserine lactone efflux protein